MGGAGRGHPGASAPPKGGQKLRGAAPPGRAATKPTPSREGPSKRPDPPAQKTLVFNNTTKNDTIRVTLKKSVTAEIDKKEVYKVLFVNNVDIKHILKTPVGFSVITDDPKSVEKILSSGIVSKLEEINLKPIAPPELQARKTLVIRGVDEMVGSHTAEATKTEIEAQNPGIQLESVIKIPNRNRFFKVVCKDTQIAEKILREGLKAFYYKIRPDQISQELFINLKICFKCFKYEDHFTNQCKVTQKICSECAETGHTFRECRSTTKRCVNCKSSGGDDSHRTLAAKCPLRKKLTNDIKSRKLNKNNNVEYSEVVRKNATTTKGKAENSSFPQIKLNSDVSIKMTALIIEAHIASLTRKEKFSTYLAQNMKLNYGIDVKFLDRNSEEIFRMLSNPEPEKPTSAPVPQKSTGTKNKRVTSSAVSSTESEEADETPMKRRKRRKKKKVMSSTPEVDSSEVDLDFPAIPHSIKLKEVGLTVYASAASAPKSPVTILGPLLLEQLRKVNPTFKVSYKREDRERITSLLSKELINLNSRDFKFLNHESFLKLKTVNEQ